ncbi:tol-pal system protein YbgF [Aliidiomarina sp. Khilg15.8]
MRITSLVMVLGFSGAAISGQAPVISAAQAQDSLEDRVGRLERILESRGESQIRMSEQLRNLQREVSELRGVTEVHANQLEQVLERQRDLYQEIDRRVSELNANRSSTPTVVQGGDDNLQVAYSDNLSENEAYDRAIALVLEEREYDRAIPEFRSFIENFPNSTYLGNAHYWLGQLLYARNDHTQAREHFSEVVNNHPNSSKRADCLLKLGIIAQDEGDASTASDRFEQVVDEYPDSTEANMARQRLQNLDA